MNISRFIGAVLIVSGTAIGGGMLALPIIAVKLGFFSILSLFFLVFLSACVSAVLLIKINLMLGPGMTLLEMTQKTLGRTGQQLAKWSLVLLSYALLSAYLTGTALFLQKQHFFQFFEGQSLMGAAAVFIILLTLGIQVIDQLNKILFVIMVCVFVSIIARLFPEVDYSDFYQISDSKSMLWISALPVLYTAFGFHGSIPVIVKYIGHHPKVLRRIIMVGSAIPLLLYLAWIFSAVGVLTANQIHQLNHYPVLSNLIHLLQTASNHSEFLSSLLNLFYGLAVITSLLGVGLGLFDHISALFKSQKNQSWVNISVGFLTVIPAVLVSLLYPKAFIAALGYAAVPLAFISIFIPLAMMQQLKQQHYFFKYEGCYWFCGLFTLIIVCAQLAVAWSWVPDMS